jgi:hypothetical protein
MCDFGFFQTWQLKTTHLPNETNINDAFDSYDEFSLNSFFLRWLDIFFHHLKQFFKWYFVTEVNIIKGSSQNMTVFAFRCVWYLVANRKPELCTYTPITYSVLKKQYNIQTRKKLKRCSRNVLKILLSNLK